jgi:6-phosphofructokinase 1
MARLFEVFEAHNIRYFLYIGGNDSQDTASQIHHEAVKRGYELRVMGVPKTIDNDLPHTDNCPGYGSAIKYAATTVMEIALDVGSMVVEGGSCIMIEVMGRSAGWIAAGTALARRAAHEAPHIVLIPEIAFEEEAFLKRVREVVEAHRCCVVTVGEGLKNKNGEELAQTGPARFLRASGASGAAEHLERLVSEKLKIKARSVKLAYAQRAPPILPALPTFRSVSLRRSGGAGCRRGQKRLLRQNCPALEQSVQMDDGLAATG